MFSTQNLGTGMVTGIRLILPSRGITEECMVLQGGKKTRGNTAFYKLATPLVRLHSTNPSLCLFVGKNTGAKQHQRGLLLHRLACVSSAYSPSFLFLRQTNLAEQL